MNLDCDSWLCDRLSSIDEWWDQTGSEVVDARQTYSWPPGTPTLVAVAARDELAQRVSGEARAAGSLSRPGFADVLKWGFNNDASVLERSSDEDIIRATAGGLRALAGDDAQAAAAAVGQLPGVGISRSTKIFALVDPDRFGIYDSRVGNGLRDLTHRGRPMIHVPPGRVIKGTTTDSTRLERAYAEITCLLRYLVDRAQRDEGARGVLRRPADVEMALFMRGATT